MGEKRKESTCFPEQYWGTVVSKVFISVNLSTYNQPNFGAVPLGEGRTITGHHFDPVVYLHRSTVKMFQKPWCRGSRMQLHTYQDDDLVWGISKLRVAEGKRQVMNLVTSSSLCFNFIFLLRFLFLYPGCSDHWVALC